MPKLTDQSIKHAPEGILWDDTLSGFGIRKGKTKTTFIVLVASGRRHRIGHYPAMSLADARREARRMIAEKTLGKIHPKHLAYEDAKQRYLEQCATKLRPSTLRDYRYNLDNYFDFGRASVSDIKGKDILRMIDKVTQSRKRYAFATIRAFMKWCVRQDLIEHSPMEKLEPPQSPESRTRILSPNELGAIKQWVENNNTAFGNILGLLLYTGQRRGEVSRFEWDWVHDDTITIPASVTKNHIEHTFPLSSTAKSIIKRIPVYKDCPYLFPAARTVSEKTTIFNGWSKPKNRLDNQTGITDWVLHDIRRTVASGLASLGVPQIVVEKLLNHVSGGAQTAISRIYNRHQYMPEMRNALLKWEEYLVNLS